MSVFNDSIMKRSSGYLIEQLFILNNIVICHFNNAFVSRIHLSTPQKTSVPLFLSCSPKSNPFLQ